jgi:hypothetical protein
VAHRPCNNQYASRYCFLDLAANLRRRDSMEWRWILTKVIYREQYLNKCCIYLFFRSRS